MIISRFPPGQPVAERAIPTPIFNTEPKIRNYFLRKWSHDASITDFDIRNFIDWDYYIDRFSTTIRKIITIPAGIQNIDNPIDRVKEPDWLRRLMERNRSSANQSKISGFFRIAQIPAGVKYSKETEKPRESASNPAVEDENPREIETSMETVETVETEKRRNSVKRNADFPAWLAQRKRQWREFRGSFTGSTVSSSSIEASRGYYQILEIEASANGNDAFFWVLNPAGKLQKLQVQVNHVLYIHSATSLEDPRLKPVQMTLPVEPEHFRGYLYELEVKGKELKRTLDSFHRISLSNSILGIYQSQIPIEFWAFLRVGCVSKLSLPNTSITAGILKHAVNLGRDPLELSRFSACSVEDAPYLTCPSANQMIHRKETARFSRIFLYINQLDKNRGIWAVFRILETNQENPSDFRNSKLDVLFIEQNSAGNQMIDRVPFKSMLSREFHSDSPRENSVSSQIETTFEGCITAVNRYLEQVASSSHPVLLIHTHSPFSRGELRNWIRILNEFPMVSETSSYQESHVTELTWRREVAGKAIQSFVESFTNFSDRIRCARYAGIPAGNVANDMSMQINDVMFARYLIANKCVLWCTPRETPDFGGNPIHGLGGDSSKR